MFKAIKWLIFIAIVTIVVLWVTGYKIGGRTVSDYARGVVGAKAYDDGVKDIRSLVGEAIKAVGEAVSPEPTPDEKKELEDVIKKELTASEPVTEQAAPLKEEAKPVAQPEKKEGGK